MDNLELRYYLRPLLKWWWFWVVATGLAAASGYLYTKSQPLVYRSNSTIMIGSAITDPNPNNNSIFLSQQLARTYADIATRDNVRLATMMALGISSLPSYSVAVVPNTQLIEISVDARNPELAYGVANELVNQLILQSPAGQERQGRQEFVTQQLAKLEQSILVTEQEISKNQAQLLDILNARQIADKQKEIATLEDKLATLQTNYTDMLASTQRGAVNTIQVIEKASIPTRPVDTNLLFNVALAAVVGLVLAAGGAYLIEYMDDSINTSDDVRIRLGINTLTAVPKMSDTKSAVLTGSVPIFNSKLIMLSNPKSSVAEAYRVLRTNLQFASIDHRMQMLLVTSPEMGDGKSITTANLAAALAHAGNRIIVVDADLHRPTQHQLFHLINNVGLSTALLGDQVDFDRVLQRTSVPGLRVLTSGPLPPNPAELLGSQRMLELLSRLRDEADTILIDSPPATLLADAAALSVRTDGVLYVLRAGKTRGDVAKRGLAALRQVNAHLAGVVLNGTSTKNSGYYYNYDAYGYGHTGKNNEEYGVAVLPGPNSGQRKRMPSLTGS